VQHDYKGLVIATEDCLSHCSDSKIDFLEAIVVEIKHEEVYLGDSVGCSFLSVFFVRVGDTRSYFFAAAHFAWDPCCGGEGPCTKNFRVLLVVAVDCDWNISYLYTDQGHCV
jgi:hypothetical protein